MPVLLAQRVPKVLGHQRCRREVSAPSAVPRIHLVPRDVIRCSRPARDEVDMEVWHGMANDCEIYPLSA
jgi:hypothetical protein